MAAVSCCIEIDAPAETVWQTMLDPEQTLNWVSIVRAVGHVDEGPLQPGFIMEQTLALRGVPFHVRWCLINVDVPTFARWEGVGPARSKAIIEYSLTAIDEQRTRVEYRNDFQTPLGPLGAVASRAVMGDIPANEARASLAALKNLIEDR